MAQDDWTQRGYIENELRLEKLRGLLGHRKLTQQELVQVRRGGVDPRGQINLLDALMGSASGGMTGGVGGGAGNPFQAGIDKIAASRKADIEQGFEDSLNTSLARLQDRGLGGSTFSLTAAQGNEAREQQALSDLSGDIGALEIRGQEAAMQQQRENLKMLMNLLGGVF